MPIPARMEARAPILDPTTCANAAPATAERTAVQVSIFMSIAFSTSSCVVVRVLSFHSKQLKQTLFCDISLSWHFIWLRHKCVLRSQNRFKVQRICSGDADGIRIDVAAINCMAKVRKLFCTFISLSSAVGVQWVTSIIKQRRSRDVLFRRHQQVLD